MSDEDFATCPCCKQKTKRPFIVDLDTNYVVAGRAATQVTRQGADIMSILAAAYPGVVNTDTLISRVYGAGNEPETAEVIIRTVICTLRRQIAALGLKIKNVHSRGYALERVGQ